MVSQSNPIFHAKHVRLEVQMLNQFFKYLIWSYTNSATGWKSWNLKYGKLTLNVSLLTFTVICEHGRRILQRLLLFDFFRKYIESVLEVF